MPALSPQTLKLAIAYLVSALLAYFSLFFFAPTPSRLISPTAPGAPITALDIDPNDPRDQVCPTNGKLFTQTEREAWEKRRPILAMIENHPDARPQSGISSADIVYEAVAEGGITRFMGVFYCGAQANLGKIAPVRSARIYFVNLAAGYNSPIYTHVGGGNCSRDEGTNQCTSDKRAWALEELADLGWRQAGGNDFDTTFDIGVPSLRRDLNRLGPNRVLATEHTMVGDLASIWKEADKRGFADKMADDSDWLDGFRAWQFSADKASQGKSAGTDFSFNFWEGYKDFLVNWKYDGAANLYRRYIAGQAHKDLENDQQISASAVIIQFVEEEGPIDIHKHMLYGVIGSGDAAIHQNGQIIEASWKKLNQTTRTVFYDSAGKEIVFTPGQMWIELVPDGNDINYGG